jgi:two-component system cell cycle sensor histidine kinase/response regulator CckA
MQDQDKNREQLIDELIEMRRKVAGLEAAQKTLNELESEYREIIDKGSEAVFVVQDGTIKFANPAYLELTEYLKEDVLVPEVIESLVHPYDREMVSNYHARRQQGETIPFCYNFRIVCKRGNVKWVELNSSLIMWEGKPAALCLATDITDRKLAEKERQDSAERFRKMFEMHSAIMLLIEPITGAILDANKAAERFYGYTRSKLRSMSIQNINALPPDEVKVQWNLALKKQQDYFIFPHRLANGDVRTVEVHSAPIEQNGTSILFSIIHDITDRKKTEASLRENEERYRIVADFTYDWEYWVDSEGNFLYVSPSCERITGYSAEEFINDPDLMNRIIHPDDRTEMLSHYHNMRKVIPDASDSMDFRIIRRDGATRWIGHVCQPVQSQEGRPLGRRGNNRDITNSKRHELAQKRLFTAIEQATDAIFITDLQGNIQYVNPAFERITGYTKEDVHGEKPSLFRSEEYDAVYIQRLQETLARGENWGGRLTKRRKDGTPYEEDVTVTPVRDASGTIVNFVGVKRDVSREAQLQRQLLQAQKMEAVGTLAGGIAHDFNNLLQAITGYSELLMGGKNQKDPEFDDLKRIYDSSKRGADLVKSLLLFSRKVQPELRPVDLNHEIVEVQKLLSHTIAKTIKIDLRLSGKLESVLGDTSQIGQVLMNLCVNARDAMPDGGTLTIETTNVQLDKDYCAVHPEEKPGPYVLLAVSDTGQGMDKETLSQIFDPFFTTKGVGKGTGLGLATVFGIVKQHGGQITCYSEPGQGTTFKIFFPAIQTEKTSETQIQDAPIQRGTETILLVDDEESLRKVNSRLLYKYGYRVIMASNGKEALEIYQREGESISLIILDLIMPVMDGRKCLEEILRVNPNAKVIIASGDSEKGLANFIRGKRVKGFVNKPYDIRELLTTIREVLDKDVAVSVNASDGR